MASFEILEHTNTPKLGVFVVHPLPASLSLFDGDYIQMEEKSRRIVQINDLFANVRRRGSGTVLLHAGLVWAQNMSLDEITGHFVTDPAMHEEVRRWYENRSIKIENGYLVGSVATVLGVCAQIMTDRNLTYSIVKK